jgi:DNA-binding PadR family transcriptional regulator
MKKKEFIKPTLLDYAILGLIQDQPLSGYAIRKLFEETALGNYSSSPGTIYPALNRLQKFELVKKTVQGKTDKTWFEITTNGVQILKKWFLKPVEKIEVKKKTNELLLRFGFMENLVDKKQRINFLTSFHNLLNIYIKELQAFYDKESNNMPLHGRLAFQFGIDSNKTTLKWCKKAISQLVLNDPL